MLLYVCTLVSGYSQITIGSSTKPAEGALLQLKEQDVTNGEVNASKGLSLPRVGLVKKDMLFPMFADNGSNGYVGANKTTEDELHIGLVVYNVNGCAPFGAGIYVWNGTEWASIFSLPSATSPTDALATIPLTLNIPSGRDKRLYASEGFTFNYPSGSGNPEWNNLVNTINAGIAFGNPGTVLQPGNTANPSAGGTWTATPATFSILPNMLPLATYPSVAGITDRKPWYTKESTIDITMPGNACEPTPASRTVKLNQTNYALVVKQFNHVDSIPYILHTIRTGAPDNKTIFVMGNALWQLTSTTSDNVALTNIISNTPTPSGGQEISNGTSTSVPVLLTGAPGVTGANGSNGNYATFTFSDPTNKAFDAVVDVMQCRGSLYTTGTNIVDASSTATSQAGNPWGDAVVRHADKGGVYEEFYSAYFGAAGRWMITNLSAYNYDDLIGAPAVTIDDQESSTVPYIVLPQPGQGTDLTDPVHIGAFPEYGYLYNYPAASAGSNSTGVQGICPKGWHLPTETEWLALQSAVTADPTKYALRPTTSPGTAMMNACEVFSGGVLGLSKPLPEGGFNVFLMGYANDDGTAGLDMQEIGIASVFWSSNPIDALNAKTYVFANNNSDVMPLTYFKKSFMSVRCKKN